MHILLLSQFFHPEPIFKGLPFARGLMQRGHRVEVVTGFPNYPAGKIYPGYRLRAWQRETIEGVSLLRVPLFPSHDASAVRRMLNYLTFAGSAAAAMPWLRSKPDVIYVYNLITLGPAARLARLLRGCRIVVDVQDLWPDSVASSGMLRSGPAHAVLKRWSVFEYSHADRLTVLSPGFKARLVAQGVPEKKIDVIYNWCDEIATGTDAAQRKRLRQELGFEERFNIVFAGTMGKVQALDAVLMAAAQIATRHPRVLFSFLGGGIEVARLKARAAGMPNVQFLAQRSPAEALKVLEIADALLVHLKDDPLFRITIPSKTQAYLFAGRPILMGVRGDAAELVQRAGAGLGFEPESPASLVGAIESLLALPEESRLEMARRGRAFYDEHLSFARGLDRFENVFRDALAA